MTDPDAAGGGGEYQVVVGESILSVDPSSPLWFSPPCEYTLEHLTLAIARANDQDSDGQTA